jgi:Tetratricopeptide repeat
MEQESKGPETQRTYWKPVQVYVLAGVCLLIGLPVGYLLRGSAPEPTPAAVQSSAMPASMPSGMPANLPAAMPPSGAAPGNAMPGGMPHPAPTLEDMKHMADKKAEPLLAQLKSKPNDAKLLNQIGIVYRSAHQFDEAQQYFQKSLAIDPKNADVRTDMAACMFYAGDVDGAISQLQQALKYDPKHPGALMNLGIIQWKAKNDVPDALASWQKLLKLNPDFPEKGEVERLIAAAQQSSKS